MSSVRISPHSRPAAAARSVGEASKSDASPPGGGFAVALGAAALFRQANGIMPFGAETADAADTTARKRPGDGKDDGKGSSGAAALAAQGLLSVAAGQLPPLPPAAAGQSQHASIDVGVAPDPAQLVGDAVSNAIAPGERIANGLMLPSTAPAMAAASDDSTVGTTVADAAAGTAGLLSNLGPNLPTTPHVGSSPAMPALSAEFASALPPLVEAAQASIGGGGTGTGGEGRFRFGPATVPNQGNLTTAAAALGGPTESPALPSAPSLAAAPTMIADSSEAGSISAQLSAHVTGMLNGQSREMVMRLHPPELGEVTVRVAVNGRDVSAWFGSPQAQVQTAIAGGMGQLQADLGNAGYNLSGAWIGADASGAGRRGGNLLPAAAPSVAMAGLDPPDMTAASRPAASGLNIYV